MTFDPSSSSLDDLFRDRHTFDSSDDWRRADFKILRASDNKITVASHKDVPQFLFKKYVRSGKREDEDNQLENYETRLEGADRLRELILRRDLRRVAVPRKWLRALPSRFGSDAHILIVERFDLLDDAESANAYRRIREDVLRDLCVALYHFRGLDSTAKNVPFTADGKIAFVDTEHWKRHGTKKKRKRRPWLKYLGQYLSSDRQRLARKIWDQLDDDSYRHASQPDDFDTEEDTSSSSS